MDYEPIEYTEYIAEKLQVAASVRVTNEAMRLMDPKVSVEKHPAMASVELRLRGFVLAGCPKEVHWKLGVPATWWDGFILAMTANPSTWVGRWVAEHWVAEMEVHEFKETYYARVCPHGVIEVPSSRGRVEVREAKPLEHVKWVAGEEGSSG